MVDEKTSTPAGGSSWTTDNLSSLPTDHDSDEDVLKIDILRKMDVDDLVELRRRFSGAEGALNREEFVRALEDVVGGGGGVDLCSSAGRLFDLLDDRGAGRVTWDRVLDGIIERSEPSDESPGGPLDPDVSIHRAHHCKRESIVKIVPIETKAAFCYAVVSKLGRVGVYDGGFELLDSYKLALKPDDDLVVREFDRGKEEKQKRSQSTWIADAVHAGDANALLFASSDRSLHVYDSNCLVHIPLCRIIGLGHVPTCLEYFSGNDKPSLLFVGDDSGSIITIKFHQAKTTLFKKKHPDKLDNYYWSELSEQAEYVTYSVQSGVHNDSVIQITYCPNNDAVVSCSNDSNDTLLLRHLDGRRQPYVFRVSRGVRCFHYEHSMHVIATGSNDFVVRLWNEVVTKQPIVSLYGHKAAVVDVRLVEAASAVVSLSKLGVVKVWDVNDYYCRATLPIRFPILNVAGARVDFGTRSLYPGPKTAKDASEATSKDAEDQWSSAAERRRRRSASWNRKSIVVACSNFVAVLRLTQQQETPDGDFLPPPPREHFASAPSPWKIAESYAKTPDESEGSESTIASSVSSSRKAPKHRSFAGDSVKAPAENMNAKRTQYDIKQEQMRMLVEQCAPHLALDLHELEPIKFSRPLPVTRNMREKGIDVSDPERVIKAKMQKDPTVASLASSCGSSRSSKSTAFKKRFAPSRGRVTPDWFAEKIRSGFPDSATDPTTPVNLTQQ